MAEHSGTCFCGNVEIKVSGEPKATGYCHCSSCRSWAAAPINAFCLWPTANVEVTRGQADLATFHKTDNSLRQFCRRCGGHVMTAHPAWGLVDVYAATTPSFKFDGQVHVNYAETVLPIKDGKPKFRDLPKEMGGSGEMIAER
jgi:hypothetical protein